ncbi:hypothetical protein KM043_004098 [Ampulex compressa]|nr:hypothetical protein KM043_004098 [Ampulex compressa]
MGAFTGLLDSSSYRPGRIYYYRIRPAWGSIEHRLRKKRVDLVRPDEGDGCKECLVAGKWYTEVEEPPDRYMGRQNGNRGRRRDARCPGYLAEVRLGAFGRRHAHRHACFLVVVPPRIPAQTAMPAAVKTTGGHDALGKLLFPGRYSTHGPSFKAALDTRRVPRIEADREDVKRQEVRKIGASADREEPRDHNMDRYQGEMLRGRAWVATRDTGVHKSRVASEKKEMARKRGRIRVEKR